MTSFKRLTLTDWRQFDCVDISLLDQICILTGPNGCGKTTILNVLGKHFGWNTHFVAPAELGYRSSKRLWSDYRKKHDDIFEPEAGQYEVGRIEYDSGAICTLSSTRFHSTSQYELKYGPLPVVDGLHIPSHAPAISYQPIKEIPTDPRTSVKQYESYRQLLQLTYGTTQNRPMKNPATVLKQSLISLALMGEGNSHVAPNYEYARLFDQFQEILRIVLPDNIGFNALQITPPDVMLETGSGRFALDAMSGGINAIVVIAWQILMYGADKDSCTVVMDEPENHLHPSMQRSLLPSLARAFPTYKFVVATHSPFIVTSSPDASVYGLVYDDERRIRSEHINYVDLSSTPDVILREILDVPTTLPIWVEEKIRQTIASTTGSSPKEQAAIIYGTLKQMGLADHLSQFNDGADNK